MVNPGTYEGSSLVKRTIRMAHAAHFGVLTVIYEFDVGDGPESGQVSLQDWRTNSGFQLRRMIWEDSENLFSKHGFAAPARLQLWNSDAEKIDLEKELGEIFGVAARSGNFKVHVTSAQAKQHNELLEWKVDGKR